VTMTIKYVMRPRLAGLALSNNMHLAARHRPNQTLPERAFLLSKASI
jgi:hypothetical protein